MANISAETHTQLVDAENREQANQQPEEIEDEESFCYAMQLGLSTVLSFAMQSATQLGIFDIINKAGPGAKLSGKDIATQLCCKNPEAPAMLDRILRLLASHSVLHCSVVADDQKPGSFQRLYSLAPVARFYSRNAEGVSLGPFMALIQDKIFLDSWSQLKDAILEGGIPFNKVHGTHAFEYPGLDSRFNQVFNAAMINQSTLVVKKILETYKGFEEIKTLVDVGGGLGVNLNLITSKYPHIHAINFDLPHVMDHAFSFSGVEHVGGDMFDRVPKGDAIFMKWILHDWSDEMCLKLLKNCYNAIPPNGKVIVVEGVVSVIPETSAAAKSISQCDVLMMTQNPGGKERTEQEFMELATSAGFNGIRYECFVRNYWVMEFFK
ncbi:hypothetical protein L6164_013322 [Bauhinia variegata]|uniref:Uncharacterized protein n=1 Tax=Bauhinia variegata TaxID=167791 RepID=A0ACB9PBZ6_BAUVA|nr:hypothetical protein L6164_013322 [Bauhinia variegata]